MADRSKAEIVSAVKAVFEKKQQEFNENEDYASQRNFSARRRKKGTSFSQELIRTLSVSCS